MAETRATIVAKIAALLGFTLREKQMETICTFIKGHDVFCCLSTGFGKSLCYAILPKVFDRLNEVPTGQSLVICVSPLTALMMDQKEKLMKMGITAEFISEIHQDLDKIESGRSNLISRNLANCRLFISLGAYQLLFISKQSTMERCFTQ